MLYIFLVDTGNMIQLDMNLALETVGYLKGVIARSCCIPPEKQVLLISGGESLEDEEKVCKYVAGTDTNPIFLFSLASIDNPTPPEITMDFGMDADLSEKVEAALKLKDTQTTVSVRAALAQELVKASSEQTRICETLIHDQHLQHQGWAAVVANLEDTAMELQRNGDRFSVMYRTYLDNREHQRELIEVFDEDMALLHQIPVFPALLKAEPTSMVGSVIPNKAFDGETMTLLEWINSRGSSQSLEQLADSCYRSLGQLDDELLTDLQTKVSSAVDGSHNAPMKEIRGLGDRLSALEQLLIDAKRLVQEQADLAKAFVHNQQRASGLNDMSILPDLCASHREQLIVMRQNHHKVISIRTRCAKAKSELSVNLHHRMKWVVFIQNQMAEVKGSLILHSEELKRLERRLQVIEQLHLAPSMYLATAVEVVRRKAFSKHFLAKANGLADKFSQLHKEEIELRTQFQAKLKKHFMSKMFPGMDDLPPEFATIHPNVFDNRLPDITLSDVDLLRKSFPDLAKSLSLPDENALQKLLTRSFNQTLTPEEGETLYSLQSLPQKLQINSSDIGSVSVMNKLIAENFVARKKFSRLEALSDSETDTELATSTTAARRRQTRKKSGDKLTRSLPPMETSSILVAGNGSTSQNGHDNGKPEKTNGGSHEIRDGEPSSSSSGGAPSSSSGATTANCSSVAPSSSSDGSKVTSQQWPTASNDHSTLIASLSTKVSDTESRISKLHDEIRFRCEPTLESLTQFREELFYLKSRILEEREAYKVMFDTVSRNLVESVEKLHQHWELEGSMAVAAAEERLCAENAKEVAALNERIELEMHKLEDCQREIENYRIHFEQTSVQVDHLKEELTEEREKFKREKRELEMAKDAERDAAISSLTLEHELELDGVRHKMEHSDRAVKAEHELVKLKEEIMMKENDIEALRRKTRLLETAEKERFNCEKEKIVQILEAGFAQREKIAVQQSLDVVEAKHKEELVRLEKRLCERMKHQVDTARDKIKADFEKKLSDDRAKFLRKLEDVEIKEKKSAEAALNELKATLMVEKEAELRAQADRLNAASKRELDALRQRFKIMQTAGALERSPSASESELSLESPRQDVIDSLRQAMLAEVEGNFKSERSKMQRQLDQLRQEKQQLQEAIARGKLRDTAEQQVHFNEALKKAVEEKNRELDELRADAKSKEDLISSLRAQIVEAQPVNPNEDVAERLTELMKQNAKLKMELQEANNNLEKIMSTSVLCLPQQPQQPTTAAANSGDVAQLQLENEQLKEKLSKSMISLVKSGCVTVNSVDKGDIVMIVWNEDHGHYIIYHEASTVLYFLRSESINILGLNVTPRKSYTTGEVVDKQYCQARKAENRFKVPQGTRFYRVSCKPPSAPSAEAGDNALAAPDNTIPPVNGGSTS